MTIGMIGGATRQNTRNGHGRRSNDRNETERQQAIEQARNINLVQLVGRYTQLRRKSGDEWEGPCPKCGGENRCVVDGRGWFCRQCKPFDEVHGWYGPIDFIMWQHGLSFREAVAFLTGVQMNKPMQTVPAVAPVPSVQTEEWRQAAERIVVAAQERLLAGENPGGEYLLRRGLEPHTWMAFGMGFGKHKAAPAIVLPWYRAGKLTAIRYRFLQPLTEGSKIVSQFGSVFGGVLYGGQALLGAGESRRTLVVCEGELNAASIWQAAHEAAVDVLSLGSESATITDGMAAYAARFAHVIVWMDKPEVAHKVAERLGTKTFVNSPTVDGREMDANALLQAGKLGGFLTTVRARACVLEEHKERLLWDIVDAARLPIGIDRGTATVAGRIAQVLGKQVMWLAGEDGQYRVA